MGFKQLRENKAKMQEGISERYLSMDHVIDKRSQIQRDEIERLMLVFGEDRVVWYPMGTSGGTPQWNGSRPPRKDVKDKS